MSGALKAKIIVVVVLLALTAALVGTCIAYRNRACEHTSLEHIEAVEPTCTESGNIEHWACKRCGATFKDESGAEEIGRVVRTALGHDLTRHSAVEPTCTEAGNVEYWECERCGVIFADSEATKPLDDHIVAASGHDWNEPVWNWSDDYSKATAYFVCNKDSEHVESVTAKVTISSSSATCTGSGRITYLAKAELDGKTYSDSEVVQSGALGHDWTVSEWIWSNDHTSVTAKFVCSRDPSHTHELTETEIVIDEDPATCLADGKTEYSVEISFDGNTYSDTAVVTLPATGHNWSDPEWTWSGNYSAAEATFTCLNDPLHTETVNAVVSILSSSATCTEPGNTEYKAELSFNENVYTDSQSVSGEALGHNWAVVEWIWSEDYTSVTAKFVCSRDPSHTHEVTETEIVVNEVTATCEKEGKTEYSVEIVFDGNTYSDTAVVTHPATGHNWSAPEWTWSEDSSEAAATFTCQNDPSHTETLAAEVTIVDTTATCTAPGETGFMAKVTFNGKDHTDKQTVTGEALGHAWTVSEWIWSKDYTSVTAKFVCSRDNSHTRAISGQIKEDVIKPVSCTEDGESTFTATVSLDGDNYTDQKASVVVKAKGHVLSENWSADDVYHWHECTVCGEKRDLSKHELVDFICSVCNHTIIYTAGLEYTLSDDGASYLVSGIGTATDKDIKIMPRYDGKPVTGIADNALEHKSINSVLIPDGVESIGANAFYGCGYLTKVVIPGSVKSIGIYAFDNCRRITRIDYSGDITGWLNIEGLIYLMSYVSSSCELYIGGIKVEGNIVIPDGVTSIPSYAFRYQTGITSVTISDSVTSIGKDAFSGCSSLTSVTIGTGVRSIGSLAFQNCSGLTEVTIGNGVTSIGSYAFYGCSSLTSVTIPDSVTSIGEYAFYDCGGLQSVTIGNGVTSIGSYAFINCEGLTEINWNAVAVANFNSSSNVFYNAGTTGDGITVTFGESVKIPAYLFYENDSSYRPNIKSVTIGNAVNSIGYRAFYYCRSITRIDYSGDITGWLKISGLNNLLEYVSSSCELYIGGTKVEELVIPDGVTSIPSSAFKNLKGITSVTIPDSVTSIGFDAFYNCISLTEVTIPDSVTSIGSSAFRGCSLTEVTIPDSVTSIGSSAFSGCSGLTSVTIPDSVTSIGSSAFYNCSGITRIDYSGDITGWLNIEGLDNLMKYVSSSCELYFGGTKVEELVIPDGVTSIPSSAFENLKGITSVTIPDSVTSIGVDAFEGCINLIQKVDGVGYVDKWVVNCDSSVTAANIRSDTVGIADRAFYDCTTLQSVTIPDSVKSIGIYAFYKDSGLQSVTIGNGVTCIGHYAFYGCSSLTSVTIGNGVTSIENYAFYGCSRLSSVRIPDSVTSIGDYAFSGCSGLRTVTIGNGVTGIGDYAFARCTALSTLNWNAVNVSGFNSSNNVFNSAGTGGNGISVTFGDSVESIPGYLFYSNYSSYIAPKITKITIGDNVKSIGSHAFRGVSSVSSVIIPASVESIGSYAFSSINTINCEAQSKPTNWSNDWADSSINVIWGYNNYDSGEFDYVVRNNKTYITKYKGSGTEVTIPDTLGGYKVVSFGEIFKNNTNITKVVIGNNVTSVSPYAFYGCSSLTSVTIPDSVTSIGSSAFSGCSSLTSVTIPDSVTSIGSYAFEGCTAEIVWGDEPVITEIGDDAFAGYKGTSFVIPDSVTSIGESAFYDCSGLKSVTIGNGVTSIGGYAFRGCSSLTSVTIPDSVTSIGGNAFLDCSSLTSVTIPDSVTSIEMSVFSGCSGLTSITIPDSVTSIGSSAFSGCSSLTSIIIPDSVNSIVWDAFSGCSGLETVTIGNGVTSIEESAFKNFSSLTEVTIGNGVTSIGSYAFYGCSSLTSVTIPDSVTSIGEYAFYDCGGLQSVTIGNGVTSIGDRAFYGCSDLTSVTIPDSVTSIGSSAFFNCGGLQSVTIGNGVTSIGSSAFYNCISLTSVTIPDSVTSIGTSAFSGCSNITRVDYAGDITGWMKKISLVGLMSYVSSSCELYFGGIKVEGNIVIPDGVTSIPGYAFRNLKGITSVTIPDSVTSIGSSAFYGCSNIIRIDYSGDITGWLNIEGLDNLMEGVSSSCELFFRGIKVEGEIIIPEGVTSIAGSAFRKLTGITSLTIPDSVTSIGQYAFQNCNGITSIDYSGYITGWLNIEGLNNLMSYVSSSCELYIGGTKVEGNIVIPDGVTSIAGSAFRNLQGITSLTIPDSVTSIGWYAFYNCSRLTEVTIPDSVTSIGSYAFSGCSSITRVDYSGDISGWLNIEGLNNLMSDVSSSCELYIGGTKVEGDIIIPEGVSSITGAFANLSAITSVTIPDSVTSIGTSAFYNCSGLQTVTIGNGVTSIGNYAFEYCSSLTEVTIPDSVTSIGRYAFSHCSGLTEVTIPDSVTSIGEDAFSGCSSLTSVTIPDSVTSIGDWAFSGCSSLTEVTIGNGVTSIGDGAFSRCSGLKSVTIGNGVTSIGNWAFNNCSSLTSATFKNTSGWSTWTSLSSVDLANKSTAAQYLRATYVGYTWTRS